MQEIESGVLKLQLNAKDQLAADNAAYAVVNMPRPAKVLVVTHGGVIRAGVASWLELPDHAIFRLDQSYCGVTVVEWVENAPIVRVLNGSLR